MYEKYQIVQTMILGRLELAKVDFTGGKGLLGSSVQRLDVTNRVLGEFSKYMSKNDYHIHYQQSQDGKELEAVFRAKSEEEEAKLLELVDPLKKLEFKPESINSGLGILTVGNEILLGRITNDNGQVTMSNRYFRNFSSMTSIAFCSFLISKDVDFVEYPNGERLFIAKNTDTFEKMAKVSGLINDSSIKDCISKFKSK